MSLDNIAITITGTPDQLAPITDRLTRAGHVVRLVDLPEMLLECDMTAELHRRELADSPVEMGNGGPVYVDVSEPCTPTLAEQLDVTWSTPDEQLDTLMGDGIGAGLPATWPEPSDSERVETFTLPAWPPGVTFELDLPATPAATDPEPEDEHSPPLPETTPDEDQAEDEPVPDTTSTTIRPAGIDDPDRPLGERITALLEANPDREWTAPQVSEHITDARNNGVISATLSQLITAGRVNRVGRGRYTAPATSEPDDVDDQVDDTDEEAPLPRGVNDVLEFLRRDSGSWTVAGLVIQFPHHSEISMRNGVLSLLTSRGLVERHPGHGDGAADAYRAVPA